MCQRSTGLKDLSLDMKEADGCAQCIGPALGCATGCATFWCCCRGCVALYCGVKASRATVSIGDRGRDDDVLENIADAILPDAMRRDT